MPLTADACHCLFTVDFLIHLNSKGFTPRQYLVWYRCSVRTLKPKCIDSLSQFNHLLHSKLLRRMVSPMPNRATKMVKSEILRITKVPTHLRRHYALWKFHDGLERFIKSSFLYCDGMVVSQSQVEEAPCFWVARWSSVTVKRAKVMVDHEKTS